MNTERAFRKSFKTFLAKLFTPFFLWWQKRHPEYFEKIEKEAGSLDYSAMQTEFNSLHQVFFQNMLSQVQIDPTDVARIRKASEAGQIVYMMRNWGQIEYNFFNSLFLKEKLPLASHSNLIRMFWWMPLKNFFHKILARLNFFYREGRFPDLEEKQALLESLKTGKSPFVFLNLPVLLNLYRASQKDLLLPLLEYACHLPSGQKLTLIPLDFLYDRRPGKMEKSLVDILFGEKENPGTLRKMVLFFRNYNKRAVAKVGEALELGEFLKQQAALSLPEQSLALRNQLHHDFYKNIFTVTGPPLKSRETMIDLTLQDKDLRQSLLKLAPDSGKAIDQLYLESQEILEEIVSDPSYTYLELWDLGLSWVFKNIYDGLEIDPEGLAQVKLLAKNHPVILVPSHRSHMDYLLMSDIFYQQKLSMPLVAAGSNLSFWPMGHLFRKSGAYFLRRSFGSDPLYPLLFKAYTKTLLKEGYFQEFFIEGTRSRTGKLEEPRTGMLSLYLDCYFEINNDYPVDFYFMPISINYEKVLEDKSHVQESKGGKKEKENFWDLLKVRKLLKHRYGKVYINFGEAISMKNYLNLSHLHQDSKSSEKRKVVKSLAFDISKEIEKVSVITAPNLVAAALLSHPKKGQSYSDLQAKLKNYEKALALHPPPLSTPILENFDKAMEQALQSYIKQGLVQVHHDGQSNFYTLENQHRPSLDYYKNALLPPLVHVCLGSWILDQGLKTMSSDVFEANYERLRQFFSHEFIHIPPPEEALKDLEALKIIRETPDGEIFISNLSLLHNFSALFANYAEAYQVCAQALEQVQFVKWDEKKVIQTILDYGKMLDLKGELQRPEALSQFLIKNAVHALRDAGFLLSHENELGKKGRQLYSSAPNSSVFKNWHQAFRITLSPFHENHISNEFGSS